MSIKQHIAVFSDREPIHPDDEGLREIPGVGRVPVYASKGSERLLSFLGHEDGPYVYFAEAPAGDVVPYHKHNANRFEILLKGSIEWHGEDGTVETYGAGTLTYVEAGTGYSYTVLEDAEILIIFEGAPGMNLL